MTKSRTLIGGSVVQRRAPFAENPTVGERGAQTQQRILDAALQAFGEVGYHACRVERITAAANCSRASFYQYFSSKEDLFRQLAGQVAQSLYAITKRLGPITPDADGRANLRRWVGEYSDIYDEYHAVFVAFASAVGTDDVVASGAARVTARQSALLARRFDPGAGLEITRPESLAATLLNMLARTNRYRHLVDRVPGSGIDRDAVCESLTDVVHRIVCGPVVGVNVGSARSSRARRRRVTGPAAANDRNRPSGAVGQETYARLLDAGAQVFATSGYHDTRVDDIVDAAETSHGTFYRYFENKHHLFRILASRAGRRVTAAMDRLPALDGDAGTTGAVAVVGDWVAEYFTTYAKEGPIIRVWVEAMSLDPVLGALTVEGVEALRRRVATFLAPRGFADVDADALVLLAFVDRTDNRVAGAAPRPEDLDLTTRIILRGFFAVDTSL